MSYGIRVENSSGFLQIDQDFVNYVLVASGSVSATGTFNNLDTITVDFSSSVTTTDTLFFARPTTTGQQGFTGFAAISGTSGDTRATMLTPYTGTIEYQVYERASGLTPPNTGYGLTVLKSDGTLAYSSEFKVPRVFSVVDVNAGASSGLITHGYSEIPYALVGNGHLVEYRYEEEPIPSIWTYMAAYWNDASTVSISYLEEESFGGPRQDYFGPDEAVRSYAFIRG